MYATKRRRRNIKPVKSPVKDPPKSNPSKRHRERLNSELDHLAGLLPFEQSVISKLDKLSILRLAVSYLRTKSYFQAAINDRYTQENQLLHRLHHRIHHGNHLYSDLGLIDSDSVLQALSGFLFIVTCDGEVFFASNTVEQYLGFHQSDIVHQSVMELIHSEDREQFKMQLNWRSSLPQDLSDITVDQALLPENAHVLRRCFTVRFRCLLDNTSGFITLEISGKIRQLQGQSLKGEAAPLALFALCCPFGPLPLHDVTARDYTFKSKHRMDMAPLSMDPRGKMFFGFSDRELMEKGGYDLVHTDDLSYYAAAHQELIKTGSSGLIAYRLLTKDFQWLWLQTSSKVIYKNSKPDFVICTHRQLTEDEGRDLARKRGTEFKLPYAILDNDSTLNSSFDDFCSPPIVSAPTATVAGSGSVLPPTAAAAAPLAAAAAALVAPPVAKARSTRPSKKSNRTQLRDYLQAGRKRKTPIYHDLYAGLVGPYAAAAAGAAAYGVPLNGGYYGGNVPMQGGEVKPEMLYQYCSGAQTTPTFDAAADQYRFGYQMYPSTPFPVGSGGADNCFRFDDRTTGSYYGGGTNGYCGYVDQYAAMTAAGLQSYANYATPADFQAMTSSSPPPAPTSSTSGSASSRYRGRQMATGTGYGLDLSTRNGGQYDRDVIALYDPTDELRRRYASGGGGAIEYNSTSGLIGVPSGAYDPLLQAASGCLYNGGVLSYGASVADAMTSSCDVISGGGGYTRATASETDGCYDRLSPPAAGHHATALQPLDVAMQQRGCGLGGDCGTVIRRTNSCSAGGTGVSPETGHQLNDSAVRAGVLRQQHQSGVGWSASSRDVTQSATPDQSTPQSPANDVTASTSSSIVDPQLSTMKNVTCVNDDVMRAAANRSSSCVAMATSVIQMSGRRRTCDKDPSSLGAGGIAVPVVKSTQSAWVRAADSSTGNNWPAQMQQQNGIIVNNNNNNNNSYPIHQRSLLDSCVNGQMRSPPKAVCYGETGCW